MRSFVAGLLVLGFAGAAFAQLPAVDPVDQYRLIGTPERSDSRCIGNPQTPLCAVETLLACFARRDPALCRAVWSGGEGAAGVLSALSSSKYWWSYRVAAAEQSAGGEAVIAVAGRNCGLLSREPDCGTTPAPPTRYRVRQVDGRWQIVDWQSQPGDQTKPVVH
ncbi:MAG: hypothetical protein VW600_15435 [Ferrovibrio sp.]